MLNLNRSLFFLKVYVLKPCKYFFTLIKDYSEHITAQGSGRKLISS